MWPYWLDGRAASTARNSFELSSMVLLTGAPRDAFARRSSPRHLHNCTTCAQRLDMHTVLFSTSRCSTMAPSDLGLRVLWHFRCNTHSFVSPVCGYSHVCSPLHLDSVELY